MSNLDCRKECYPSSRLSNSTVALSVSISHKTSPTSICMEKQLIKKAGKADAISQKSINHRDEVSHVQIQEPCITDD